MKANVAVSFLCPAFWNSPEQVEEIFSPRRLTPFWKGGQTEEIPAKTKASIRRKTGSFNVPASL